MAVENLHADQKDSHDTDSESEMNEVFLEGELHCAIKEIKRLKREVCIQKDQAMNARENLIRKMKNEEQLIVGLTIQLEESKRIEEMIKAELNYKVKECQNLEAEIVVLRRKLARYDDNRKVKVFDVGQNSKSSQINSSSLTHSFLKSDHKSAIKNSVRRHGKSSNNEDVHIKDNNRVFKTSLIAYGRLPIRFNSYFLGLCFYCKQYGHKVNECKAIIRRSDIFGHNFGHIAKYSKLKFDQQNKESNIYVEKKTKCKLVWRPKEIKNNEKSMFVQAAYHAKKKDLWVIGSGCSNHMTSDREFTKLEEYEGGCVRFGDNTSRKIKGLGTLMLHENMYS